MPRRRLATRALVVPLLLLAGVSGALPGARADDCTAKCAALMTEFGTMLPAERVTAVKQSPVWLRSSLQMFCKRKSMYAGAAARAEFGFCQHAASRALALLELERQGGQQPYAVSGLTTTCSNSTWMAFEEWEQWEQCGAGLRVGAAAAGDAAAHAAGEQAKGDASASTLPLCFSQREHEYTLDGTWVAHSSPTPSSDYWERCPAMMARGKFQVPNQKFLCRGTYEKSSAHPHMRQQAQTGGRALDQDFVPNGCSLPAFDAGGFLRATGKNQTLWFVGDSMSHQMFISTACLVAQMDDIQDVEMPPNVEWFVDEDGCKATNFKTQCILVGLGVRICYVCRFRVDAAETLHEMMTTMGSSDSNTIVFNFGLHYALGQDPNLLAAVLDEFLGRWEGFCAAGNGVCARLIWRETTPRHFQNEGGEYKGRQDLNSTCVQSRTGINTNDPRNLATEPILRNHPRVLQLPVWHMLHKRPDAHTGSECTHWCQPGVMEKAVHLLYGLLLAHDGGRLPL